MWSVIRLLNSAIQCRLCNGDVISQLQSAPFSLEHPSQYFRESRLVRGGLDSKPKQEPVGTESEQTHGGMEPDQESAAMDMATADISVKDMEDFDSF